MKVLGQDISFDMNTFINVMLGLLAFNIIDGLFSFVQKLIDMFSNVKGTQKKALRGERRAFTANRTIVPAI